ncbi:uncharacterized protein LOC131878073 isoform X2 [Tigriopus californicus]|uniref:uncharacterized protein LOC131878073 isoform X2 n=1 Tax=Tigriopus californicus TaxID=6832 RepID=UPI0027DA7063|nr:uncharacterized protein LOC131878073 isoform X2 [Tigriopus californicus]
MYGWNSVARRSGSRPKRSASLPRSISKELRQRQQIDRLRKLEKEQMTGSQGSDGPGPSPKGCFCQIGSSFKAVMFLLLILAATGALGFWLYQNKFGPNAIQDPHLPNLPSVSTLKPRQGKDLNLSDKLEENTQNQTIPNKIIHDSDPDLYIDFEGKLHKVSDLKEGKKTFLTNDGRLVVLEEDFEETEYGTTTFETLMSTTEEIGSQPTDSSTQVEQPTTTGTGLNENNGAEEVVEDQLTVPEHPQNETFSTLVETSLVTKTLVIEWSSTVTKSIIQSVSGLAVTSVHAQGDDEDLVVIYGTASDSSLTPPSSSASPRTPRASNYQPSLHTFTVGREADPSNSVPKVTSSEVITTSPFDERPSFGLEELFNKFERPKFPRLAPSTPESGSNAIKENLKAFIRPSSVIKETDTQHEGVTTLSNGVVEVDGASDAPTFDKASIEPAVGIIEDDFHVFTKTQQAAPTVTQVASTTLYSDFIEGDSHVGLVTQTGGTLIAHGVTTVHSTRVFGTYMDDGQYAQVVQSTSKIFEDEIKATPVANFGTVLHVTEKPSFGVNVPTQDEYQLDDDYVEEPKQEEEPKSSNQEDAKSSGEGVGSVEVISSNANPIGGYTHPVAIRKNSAVSDFKERLKSRYAQFKKSLKQEDNRRDSSFGRGSVQPLSGRLPTSSNVRGLQSGARKERQRFSSNSESSYGNKDTEEDDEEVEIIKPSQSVRTRVQNSNRGFKDRIRDRSRGSYRNRAHTKEVETTTPREKDLEASPSAYQETTVENVRLGGRRKVNRFRNRISAARRKPNTTPSSPAPTFISKRGKGSYGSSKLSRPRLGSSTSSSNYGDDSEEEEDEEEDTSSTGAKVEFKKFNRFSRPDLRQSLLQKILNKGGKSKGILTVEEQEEANKEADLEDSEESLEDETTLQDLGSSSVKDEDLQTTLDATTVYPETLSSSAFLEVATIRSPYSFNFEEGMSTRFITVTRTFTSDIKPSKTEEPDYKTSSPLFQTETIPAPENILTSSLPDFHPYEISSSIETLPAVHLASSSGGTPPLKTVTETFSTKELMLKTSLLPIVVNGQTKLHTLTQSYYVTRLVEAVKTIPPMDSYEFIPTKAFTDFSNVLDEAGSEKREQLLPGELEFSEQDEFSDGPHEIRVRPPPGFTDDLALIGSKFDPVDSMEKQHNPGIVNLKSKDTPTLQPSFGQQPSSLNPFSLAGLLGQKSQNTPSLPAFNPLSAFSPEQIRHLALLQYLQNPFGGLGGLPNLALGGINPSQNHAPNQAQNQGGQVVASKPVIRTETLFTTKTVPLMFGNKKMETTITSAIGVTTVTEYQPELRTAGPNPSLPTNPGLAFGNPFNPAAALGLQPSFQVTSDAVVKDTVIPSTVTKEVKITFRNVPTVTRLTSTTMVTTQITEYVTRTIQAAPTLNPGHGFNPYAALLG